MSVHSEPIQVDTSREVSPPPQEQANHEPITDNAPAARIAFASGTSFAGEGTSLAVAWNDIRYTITENGKKKYILKGLTGSALPGRALAIMGSSGAGKTTFLNALSDRLREDKTHELSGQIMLNDVHYEHKYRKLLAFVTQDDVLSNMQTPEDAFGFSLRIRRGMSREDTALRVDAMLEEMNLLGARNTIVGVPGIITGLSGGERKRTNIGVELISNPKVVLLDEPTSGLDSVTASRIVSVCRELAQKGRTVIYTIHQPTADAVSYFDDLMLMCGGAIAYHGTMEDAVPYFATLGYECPQNYTPTDFFMFLLQDEKIGPELCERWEKHLQGGNLSAHVLSPQAHNAAADRGLVSANNLPTIEETKEYLDHYIASHGASIGIQFVELFGRSFRNVARNKMYIAITLVQSVFFALIAGIIFVNLKDDVEGVQDRMGLLFMVTANRAFSGAMMMINTFPPEKAVFIREQQTGAYSPGIYFFAKAFSELPVQFTGVLLESIILYFVTGLSLEAPRYFHYLAITFAIHQATTGLGMLISCAVPSFQLASGLAPLCIVPQMLAGGLLASTDRLRPAWVWLEKISVIRYGFVLFAKNEFDALDHIYCYPGNYPDINGTAFCARQPQNGRQVMQNFELTGTQHSYWLMWLCLLLWIVITRFFCIVALNRIARSKA